MILTNSNNAVALTTIDNPFDPFKQFTSWFLFDCEKGYYTCSKIARIAKVDESMSEVEIKRETKRAIDVLFDNDILCVYKKVFAEESVA